MWEFQVGCFQPDLVSGLVLGWWSCGSFLIDSPGCLFLCFFHSFHSLLCGLIVGSVVFWWMQHGLIPKRIWLGDKLVMLFFQLLWTAVAMASQSDQSLGWPPVTSLRYCSTHWFFHSESLSVWGCEAVDRFCWISSCLVSAFPKCEVNLGSLSLMIFLGSPYHG